MGVLQQAPPSLHDVLVGHIASMRAYADTLEESGLPLVSRAKVIARIRKCANDVAKAQAIVERRGASRIAAQSDETAKAAQPEGQEPDPKGDAQLLLPDHSL